MELPPTGDTMRYVPPDGYYWENLSLGFLVENQNKNHVGIDLHQEEGKELELGHRAMLLQQGRLHPLAMDGDALRDPRVLSLL